MLNHVLIPLDGSLLAEEAIAPAKQLLKPKGKITLITIVETPMHWEYGVAPFMMIEEAQSKTDQFVVRAKAYLQDVASNLRLENFYVETVIENGDPATVIVDTAVAQKVDAIAMSTHGRSGISRWLFGSITSKVLSAAPCPVFVIPSKQRAKTAEMEHAASHP
jgi:nucleotide-binding universal stress UspA family protein